MFEETYIDGTPRKVQSFLCPERENELSFESEAALTLATFTGL